MFRFNGIEVGTLPTALNGLATEAQASDEGEIGASSFESGGKSSDSDTDFRVVCIYNNIPLEPIPLTCEECFNEFLKPQQINAFLALITEPTTLEALCDVYLSGTVVVTEIDFITDLTGLGVSPANAGNLVECLKNLGVPFV